MRIVTMDPKKCVACGNCEFACAFKQKQDFDRRDSNIRVNFYPEEKFCFPLTCVHCSEPWCLEVCPAGAISRNPETNAVTIDANKCAGCKMCILACPFGNIHFDTVAMVSHKCDLCGGEPNCVKFCISGALQFEDEAEAFDFKRRQFDARMKSVLEIGGKALGREAIK